MTETENISQIIATFRRVGITKTAKELHIPYKRLRILLMQNGVKIHRGRKRGSGVGQCFDGNGGKLERRRKWQVEMIEAGRCTACGERNDSESMYHCNKCLKKRNKAKKDKLNEDNK